MEKLLSACLDDIFKHHAWAGEGNAEENCRMDELNIRKGKE
jgi:hypothetical protein